MTTSTDNFKNRTSNLKGLENSEGIPTQGFQDPTGEFPRNDYFYSSSINYAARGAKVNRLWYGGGAEGVPLDITPHGPSQYPLNQVHETISGHVIEYDDTPGSERILIKHNTGAGVEMRADGTTIISSFNNKIEVTGGDHTVIVEGDGQIVYKGNLRLAVSGDLEFDVGGNFKLKTGNDVNLDVGQNYREKINGNLGSIVTGNVSKTIAQTKTDTVLGDKYDVVKGNQKNIVQGNAELNVGLTYTYTAETEMIMSSANINIAATDLSVFGATGTMGGQGIVMYGKGATFEEGVTAPTFKGNLDGKADEAALADKATGASTAGALGSSGTPVYPSHVDTPTTVKPTTSVLPNYLTLSAKGIRKVKVDIGDFLYNIINRNSKNGNVSSKDLNTKEIRSKLRDPSNQQNDQFLGNAVSEGKLSPGYANYTPPGVGRVVGPDPTPQFGVTSIGNNNAETKSKRFTPK
jgi:hypothetical protein